VLLGSEHLQCLRQFLLGRWKIGAMTASIKHTKSLLQIRDKFREQHLLKGLAGSLIAPLPINFA